MDSTQVVLAAIAAISGGFNVYLTYLLKRRDAEAADHKAETSSDRSERADALREYKRLLDKERDAREKDQKKCDAKLDRLENDLHKVRTDLYETAGHYANLQGQVQELQRQNDDMSERLGFPPREESGQ